MRKTLTVVTLVLLFAASCHNGKLGGRGPDPVPVAEMALELDESLRVQQLKNSEIGVITPVDLDLLETSSSFGRYLQERMLEELFNHGYRLVELRLSQDLPLVSKEGELILTRLKELVSRDKYSRVEAFIYGTYIVSRESVLISFRIVESGNAQIRASTQRTVKRNSRIDYLLGIEQNESRKAAETDERLL